MENSLEKIVECENYSLASNNCYNILNDLKKEIVHELESNNHAQPLIIYAKNINLELNYEYTKDKLNKILLLMESDYSKKYESCLKDKNTDRITAMKDLLKKKISSENISDYMNKIENIAIKINKKIIIEDIECMGGCGYIGEFIINTDSSYVCPNCAVVQEQEIVSVTKRAYTNEERKNKTITEKKINDFGPRTIISILDINNSNNKISAKQRALYNHLAKIQNSLVNSLERNYWEAKPIMNRLCDKLDLSKNIAETAWNIYSEAAKQKLTMGRSILGFVTASLYSSIRIHDVPRVLEEIIKESNATSKTVNRANSLIKINVLPKMHLKYKPISPITLIYKFGNELKLSIRVQQKADKLLSNAIKRGLPETGRDPKGLAAAALYLTAKDEEKKTQALISECAQITEVTLRNQTHLIKKYYKKN
ncbi:MAG: hypothetical protein PHN56_01830 [Candidatus Nanoarchaeia archaeon]|nr:hypothetical protein [Candidatus Nanoarchaeia archaeon]